MTRRPLFPLLGSLVLSAACASGGGSHAVAPAERPGTSAQSLPLPAPPVDPAVAAIAAADAEFAKGERELAQGHMGEARTAFNRAVEALLAAPGGVRADQRLSAQFDRLVDRISAMELTALATGDGFQEASSEPASIDALLALSSVDVAAPPTCR